MNVSNLVANNVKNYPNRTAVISGDDGRTFTWTELNGQINRLGNALLRLGVQKGDRVGIYLPNSPEFLISYFAITRIGAVATPFNIMYRTSEITYILNNSRAKLLIGAVQETGDWVLPVRDELPHLQAIVTVGGSLEGTYDFDQLLDENSDQLDTVDCTEDDLASMLYTSGTTGKPKGAMLTHANLLANAALHGDRCLHINDQDLLLSAAPYCHIFFVLTVLGPFHVGAGVITMKRFYPDKALELISKYRVTHFCGVPTMYLYMLQHYSPEKYDVKSWRYAQSAGASMPADYIKEIEEKFGVGFCEYYGATEISSTAAYTRLGHGKPGSVGPAANGYSLKVVDDSGQELPPGEVGELLVKGPGVFKGYWEMPEATKEAFLDGYYRTGDLVMYDEDGYFYIVDRKKDMILCGGYNVYPREVEEVLYQHPKVMEVAVLGAKDPYRGEVPKAFIKVKPGEELTEQEVIEFCKQRLAAYKVPRIVEFLDDLPKSPTGKILKRLLKEQA